MMEWSSLELKLICCSDLKAFNLFRKLSVYAVVSIINDELKKKEQNRNGLQRQKSPVDRDGDGSPEWNHMMKFDIKALVNDCTHLFLAFDLYSEGVIYGTNSIGRVRVPLKDLVDEFNGAVRFLRYQVRTSEGKPNGVLSFCYKLNGTSIWKAEAAAASPTVLNPSPDLHFASKKVQYPSVEALENQSSGISYPSLDYARSPLSGFFSPSPKYVYKATDLGNINMTHPNPPPPSPPQISDHTTVNGPYYYPYPYRYMHSPGPWCPMDSTGYGYGYGYIYDSQQRGSESQVFGDYKQQYLKF